MNPIIENFNLIKNQFELDRQKEDGWKVMSKVIDIVNVLGKDFNALDGGQLSEMQVKLAGYTFYLADYIADLNRISESLKLELKNIRAEKWDEITEKIKAVEGKVKNREQIENVLILETKALQHEQILYETLYYKYKLKLNSISDLLTAIVQKIAEKKREVEQSKNL